MDIHGNLAKWILLALLLAAIPAGLPAPPKEIVVWAVTESKTYQCPGSRFYQVGKGKKMSECMAIAMKYKPAFGRGCGSVCSK
jgi:hypothetical protein